MAKPSSGSGRPRGAEGRLERAFARELAALGVERRRILVAVSGGRDSCVLLDLLARTAKPFALELVVGHVHHGLRGAEADLDAAHVEALARAGGFDFATRAVDPIAATRVRPSRIRPSLEEAARDLRREALESLAARFDCVSIATAHHAGDQAETLLLRLLRGTGPDGLAGMEPASADARWLKPLLAFTPVELEAHARAHGLVWREDASNLDRRFPRNRLRHDVLPALERDFNPRLLRALGELAEAAREDRSWIEGEVAALAARMLGRSGDVVRFALEGWAAMPEALARRVVRHGLVEAGLAREVSTSRMLRVLAFLRRGRRAGRDKKVELPGGFSLRRVTNGFELAAEETNEPKETEDGAGEKVGAGSRC